MSSSCSQTSDSLDSHPQRQGQLWSPFGRGEDRCPGREETSSRSQGSTGNWGLSTLPPACSWALTNPAAPTLAVCQSPPELRAAAEVRVQPGASERKQTAIWLSVVFIGSEWLLAWPCLCFICWENCQSLSKSTP